jgi:hypothetical protein
MKIRSKKDGKTFAKNPAYSLFPGWPAVSNQYSSGSHVQRSRLYWFIR